jgi:methylglutaconyl-CoA hydratase
VSAVRYEVDRGTAVLTLADPGNKNALSARILNGLGDGLAAAVGDDEVRVVLLTHEGNTFCAGADLHATTPQEAPRFTFPRVLMAIQDSPKPVVAKLRGHCMGGGVGLAAAADVSIASAEVRFGFTEVRIGVAPAIISVVCLPKLSKAVAAELFLTGRKIDAGTAAAIGLINRAVPAVELDDHVDALLDDLLAAGPAALAACKGLLVQDRTESPAAAFERTAALSAALFSSA